MANEWIALRDAAIAGQIDALARKLWEKDEALYEELLLAYELEEYLMEKHSSQIEAAIEQARLLDIQAWKAKQEKQQLIAA
jgi:hypothetical protein